MADGANNSITASILRVVVSAAMLLASCTASAGADGINADWKTLNNIHYIYITHQPLPWSDALEC